MGLFVERDGHGTPLVLVHGFTQTRRCWGPEAADLATDHAVIRVDAPGHGRSADIAANLVDGARLLGEACGPGTYVGYSMGARLCLHLALAEPSLVRGMVLIGGTAGIDDATEREARRDEDAATAAKIRADGVTRFVDAWLAGPLFAGLPSAAQFRTERAENTSAGLASSIELAGTGSQQALWPRLHELTMPVLVVAGALDAKFTALAQRLVEEIGPNATLASIPGAGHAAHLEDPSAFVGALRPWLAAHHL